MSSTAGAPSYDAPTNDAPNPMPRRTASFPLSFPSDSPSNPITAGAIPGQVFHSTTAWGVKFVIVKPHPGGATIARDIVRYAAGRWHASPHQLRDISADHVCHLRAKVDGSGRCTVEMLKVPDGTTMRMSAAGEAGFGGPAVILESQSGFRLGIAPWRRE